MKKILTFLALMLFCSIGASAQTVIARMQDFVNGKTAGADPTAVTNWTTEETGGGIYSFDGSTQYFGGVAIDAIDAAFKGDQMVTVACWVYGVPGSNKSIFGYGDAQTGVKFMMNGTSFKTTTKGVEDFTTASNSNIVAGQWNLIAFAFPGKTCSTQSLRYYATATNGQYNTYAVASGKQMNNPSTNRSAVGSGDQGTTRESYSGMIANLIVITSSGLLNNSDIKTLIGEAPTAGRYAINFDNEAHKHISNGNSTTSRVVTQLKLGDQTIDVDGTGNFYQDLYDSKAFTITAGESVKPQIIWNGSWMAGYVYVEATPDCGQFTASDIKSSTNGEGTHNFTADLAAFSIENPGTYHMRYKVDWNSTDPGGSATIKTDGGSIFDVKLVVQPVEEPPVDIVYDVYFDGNKLYDVTKQQLVGSDFNFALGEGYDYVDVDFTPGQVTEATHVTVNTSYNSNLPFQVGEKYRIKLRDAFVHNDGSAFPLTAAEGYTDDYVFTISGDWYNGFTLFNEGALKYLSYGTNVNPNDDHHAGLSETADAGAHLDLLRKDGYNFFRIHGSTNNSFANKRSSGGTNYFSTWATSYAFGNEGSRVFFILDSNIDVIYNVTATDAEGNNPIHITRSETETRGQMPVVDAFDYFSDFVVTDAVAVDREHTTFNVTAKYAYPMMPGHLYQIKQGSTYVQYVDDSNVSIKKTSDATNDKNLWYVLVNDKGTFKLCNAYKGLALGATKDGANACNFKTIAEQGDNFEFVKNGDSFKIFWSNDTQNLGSHGNPGTGANQGLGKWNISGRSGGTLFTVEEVELAAIKLTNPNPTVTSGLNGKYVGTFSSVYNVFLPEGVVAYIGEMSEDGKVVNFTEIGQTVPANTGVLLYAAEAPANIIAKAAVATEPVLPSIEEDTNVFEHTAAEAKALEDGSLILGMKDAGVGFYKISAAPNNVVARYKAYIPSSAAASVARYMFDFENDGTLTEIEAIEAAPAAGNVFDLQGRRVQNAQKGLYIVGGKKVVR